MLNINEDDPHPLHTINSIPPKKEDDSIHNLLLTPFYPKKKTTPLSITYY